VVAEDDFLPRWQIAGESRDAEKAEEIELLARFGRKEQRDVTTASDPFAFATRGHLLQFEAMADAIRNDTNPPNSIETTRHTIEILNAIYESGCTKRPARVGGE